MNAYRDENSVPTLIAVSNVDGFTPVRLWADPVSHRLLVDLAGGAGTVTSVSVVSANGFAGTVATSTTTPAITLSTTITGILKGNGTAISAATAGTDYAVGLSGTINEIAYFNSATTIASLAVATYPSLTELSYIKGLTSSAQTQITAKMTNPMTTGGDLIYGGASGVPTRLANGSAGQVLQSNGTTLAPSWVAAGAGDMVLASVQTVTGLKTFDTTKLAVKGSSTGSTAIASANAGATDYTVTLAAVTGTVALGTGTINELTYWSATNVLGTLAVATYPSLTELSYVKGVTSAIQTQLGTKAPTTSPTFATSITGSYLTASEILITDGSKNIVSAAVATYPSLTELTYVKGLTSSAQTQITARLQLAGGTMTGNITLGENTGIALDPAGSADGKWTGITITGVAGETLAFGDLVYLKAADSRWWLTDADAAATGGPVMVAMCIVGGNAAATVTLLLQGQIRADAKFPALTIGAPVYLGETAGAIQVAIPTGADNVIKVVGWALTADEIYFNPSPEWQITVA